MNEFATLCARTVPIGVGVWLLLNTPSPSEMAKQIAAGAGATILTVISVRNTFDKYKDKRSTRRFLAELQALPSDYAQVAVLLQ